MNIKTRGIICICLIIMMCVGCVGDATNDKENEQTVSLNDNQDTEQSSAMEVSQEGEQSSSMDDEQDSEKTVVEGAEIQSGTVLSGKRTDPFLLPEDLIVDENSYYAEGQPCKWGINSNRYDFNDEIGCDFIDYAGYDGMIVKWDLDVQPYVEYQDSNGDIINIPDSGANHQEYADITVLSKQCMLTVKRIDKFPANYGDFEYEMWCIITKVDENTAYALYLLKDYYSQEEMEAMCK